MIRLNPAVNTAKMPVFKGRALGRPVSQVITPEAHKAQHAPNMGLKALVAAAAVALGAIACGPGSGNGNEENTAGAAGASSSTGGSSGAGSSTNTGGSSSATGGSTGIGGSSATGGSTNIGGSSGTGGSSAITWESVLTACRPLIEHPENNANDYTATYVSDFLQSRADVDTKCSTDRQTLLDQCDNPEHQNAYSICTDSVAQTEKCKDNFNKKCDNPQLYVESSNLNYKSLASMCNTITTNQQPSLDKQLQEQSGVNANCGPLIVRTDLGMLPKWVKMMEVVCTSMPTEQKQGCYQALSTRCSTEIAPDPVAYYKRVLCQEK